MRIGLMAAVVGLAAGVGFGGVEASDSNAALAYYRAWADQSTELQLTLLTGDRLSLTEGGVDLLAAGQETVVMLLRAAEGGEADWGVDLADGPGTLLPHLGKLRGSAKVLTADALRCVEDGDGAGAAARAAALFRMSRQSTSDQVLISSLVGMAIGNLGVSLTDQLIEAGAIDAHGARVVLAAIGDGGGTDRYGLRDAIVGEWRMIAEYLLMNAPEEGAGRWLLETMGMEADDAESKRIAAMDKPALMRELGGWSAYYSDMLGAWDAGDRARMDAVVERLKDGEYGTITVVMAASLTRAFDSDRKSTEDINALIERLEGIAD